MRKILLAAAAGVLAATGLSAAGGAAAATPPSTITGVVTEIKASPDNSATAKSVTVTCPGNKKVINASGAIVGGANTVLLDEIFPNKDLTKVTVTGKETDDATTPINWTVEAAATCADPPPGLKRYLASGPDTKAWPKSVQKSCPLNKELLGTGMDIIGGQGQAWASAIIPRVDRTTGESFGVQVKARADAANPPTGPWHVTAVAICADNVYQQQVLSADGDMPPDLGQLTLYCPVGTVATGTGYDTDPFDISSDEIITYVIDPDAGSGFPPEFNFIETFQKDAKVSTPSEVRDYLVCTNGT